MGQVLHGSATTIEAIRRAIQPSQASLARGDGLSMRRPTKALPLVSTEIRVSTVEDDT